VRAVRIASQRVLRRRRVSERESELVGTLA
jgi:hypothetical protein